MGYLDDTAITTDSRANLTVQTRKLELYSDWAELPVNNSKCAVTAILHHTAGLPKTAGSHRNATSPALGKAQLAGERALMIRGCPIPYLTPTDTYPYLGIQICPALLWANQLATARAKIRSRGEQLAATPASYKQMIHTIRTCIKPAVTYTFSAACYTRADIDALDREICKVVRACTGLPKGFPCSAILRSREDAGMGIGSLQVDYAKDCAAQLTRALADPGHLGRATHALLLHQRACNPSLPTADTLAPPSNFLSSLRQLETAAASRLSVTYNGETLSPWAPGARPTHLSNLNNFVNHKLTSRTFLQPLNSDLGITDLGELIDAEGKHLISTKDLERRYPKAKHTHKRALNQLTWILGLGPDEKPTKLSAIKDGQPRNQAERRLPDALHQPGRRAADSRLAKGLQALETYQPQPQAVTPEDTVGPDQQLRPSLKQRQKAALDRLNQVTPHIPTHANPIIDGGANFWTTLLHQEPPPTRAPTWEAYRDTQCSSSTPSGRVLEALYDGQYAPRKLVGYEAAQKKTRVSNVRLEGYEVEWEPTVVLAAHVQAIKLHYRCETTCDPTPLQGPPPPSLSPLLPPMTQPLDLRLIHWGTTVETVDNLRQSHSALFDTLLARFNTPDPKRGPAEQAPEATDLHLDEATQQGLTRPKVKQVPWSYTLRFRKAVTILTTPCNPDLDIAPPRRHKLQVGTLHPNSAAPTAPPRPSHPTHVMAYTPDGRCQGSLPTDRAENLLGRFRRDPTQFEQEVTNLLTRRARPNPTELSYPPYLTTVLHATMGIEDIPERLCHPLTVTPTTTRYWSEDPADAVFGALGSSYSTPWTGLSKAITPNDGEETLTAIRWAIHSAVHPSAGPTCTILTMPLEPTGAHMRLLGHESVTVLLALRGDLDRGPHDNRERGLPPPQPWLHTANPRRNRERDPPLVTIAITNVAGKEKWMTEDAPSAMEQAWFDQGRHWEVTIDTPACPLGPPPEPSPAYGTSPPRWSPTHLRPHPQPCPPGKSCTSCTPQQHMKTPAASSTPSTMQSTPTAPA